LAEEPQPGSRQRKTFLYLFDSVPGGTGYVRQLMDLGGEDLKEVFQRSLQILQSCACSDGCYRCIFRYRERFNREKTSKLRAIEQLQAIIKRWPELKSSKRSLSEININTRAESELELRFLEKLREGKGLPDGTKASLRDEVIHGRKAFTLTLSAANHSISWKLEQQVPLGDSEGVGVFSRADFLLTPTAGGKPIAIYTDGWEYHRGRLASDAQQRMALQRSGRYLFWGLSWDDVVEKPPRAQNPLVPNGLQVGLAPAFIDKPGLFRRWWPENTTKQVEPPMMAPCQAQLARSLELLLAYLLHPSEAWWQGLAQQFAQAQITPTPFSAPELTKAIEELQLQPHIEEWRVSATGQCMGQQLEIAPGLRALNLADLELHKRLHPAASFRVIHFDPDAAGNDQQQQAAWREWLRQANLFQFIPHGLISTPGWGGGEQAASLEPYAIWVQGAFSAAEAHSGTALSQQAVAWQELIKFAHPSCQPLINALQPVIFKEALALPELGYELEGSKKEVLAEAELAWPDQQLAVILDMDQLTCFETAGWRCWSIEDPPDPITVATNAAAICDALQIPATAPNP
jgi:DEAD/DEAH box helicase domain-containing protein